MSTKSAKSKSKGNGIDEKDATEIIAGVQSMYEKIPAFIRPMLPALPDILRRIPSSAGKSQGHVDLVLVAPATANTIGKLASGIDDTPVTTVAATAIGSRIPVVIAPAMHEPLYDHPLVQENVQRLKKIGVEFVEPEILEGKAKIASTEKIVDAVITRLSANKSRDLEGRRVLVTAGPTMEHIDPVRVVTNRSSGKMGAAIAEEVASRGADTTLILGPGTLTPPSGVKTVRIENTEELLQAVLKELREAKPDIVFAAGAPTDYTPTTVSPKKIKTRERARIDLELKATPKILEEIRSSSPKTFLVAFKTEYNVPNEELIDEALKIIHDKNADLVAANDVARQGVGFQVDTNELYVVDGRKNVVHIPLAEKRDVARQLVDLAIKKLKD